VRRWGVGLPFGSFGLVFGLLGLLMALPRDLHLATGPWPIVAVAIAGGLSADLLLLALRPGESRPRQGRAFAFLVPVALFGLYFAVLGLTVGLWWSPHLVGGTVFLGGLVGWLVSFLVFPPAPPGSRATRGAGAAPATARL